VWASAGLVLVGVLVVACQSTGTNPTGLYGGQVGCAEGARQTLDCRGAIQQYARDFRADVAYMQQVAVGVGYLSNKLIEADAITSDLVQHYYQTCTLYNACLITREEYVAKTERLQDVQMSVRRALAAAGFGPQQNIQINPFQAPPGGILPQGGPLPPQGGPMLPPGAPGTFPLGAGLNPGDGMQPGASGPAVAVATAPAGNATGVAAERVESILGILREGSRLVRQSVGPGTPATTPASGIGGAPPPGLGQTVRAAPAPAVPPTTGVAAAASSPPAPTDLAAVLRGSLTSLKEGVVRREPTMATARATVGNITEEGQPWSGPLGVLLQEQLAQVVDSGQVFSPAQGSLVRGIAVKPVSGVSNPNAPQALTQVYGSDIAIVGSYRPEKDAVRVSLKAVDGRGRELAQQVTAILNAAIPGTWAASPVNATDTRQILGTLGQLGPKSQGAAQVEIATNRPGAGASFRLGDEIRYVVGSTVDGYLYLFHIDASKNVVRIFPNQYQKDARVSPGASIEIPVSGAPFRFEASPPFGLETTVAIVTSTPLDEDDFRAVEGGFATPKEDLTKIVASRGLRAVPAGSAPSSGPGSPGSQLAWNFVTVLIRP
jgi:hypothetical protein